MCRNRGAGLATIKRSQLRLVAPLQKRDIVDDVLNLIKVSLSFAFTPTIPAGSYDLPEVSTANVEVNYGDYEVFLKSMHILAYL
jgi:hypothetical protein